MQSFYISLKNLDPQDVQKSRQQFQAAWAGIEPVVRSMPGITVNNIGRFAAAVDANTQQSRRALEMVLPPEWHTVDIQAPRHAMDLRP